MTGHRNATDIIQLETKSPRLKKDDTSDRNKWRSGSVWL